jgi:chemotaxis protein methyltransferase CheR
VKFDERNLVRADSPLWQPDIYDIVFFRNVLMYFTPENGQRVIARIGRALKPGGYQFLGHAETLRGLSTDFHLRHTHETFYYQRKAVLERGALHSSPITPSGERAPTVMAAVDGADTWIDAIRGATERIEILTSLPQSPASPRQGSPRAVPGPTWDLELARVLLREERFAEALEMVQHLPPESARDPDVLLLHAALLTHRGQLADAEDACRRLLDVTELSAGAHYLLALCREGARDRTGAVNHDQLRFTWIQVLPCLICTSASSLDAPATLPPRRRSSHRRYCCCSARTARGYSCSAADSPVKRSSRSVARS